MLNIRYTNLYESFFKHSKKLYIQKVVTLIKVHNTYLIVGCKHYNNKKILLKVILKTKILIKLKIIL